MKIPTHDCVRRGVVGALLLTTWPLFRIMDFWWQRWEEQLGEMYDVYEEGSFQQSRLILAV